MSTGSEPQVSWQDYMAIVIRRRWCFLAPCAVIVVVTLIVGLFVPKIYRAEAIVLVETPEIMTPLMQGMAVSTDMEQRLRVAKEELLSWTSVSRLVDKLGLGRRVKDQRGFERLVGRLQDDIRVTTRRGSLISIRYEEHDPRMAQQVVNTVTDVYIERSVESQTAEAETAIKFIDSEMEVYRKKLEDAERALREFRELYTMEMPVATQLNNQIVRLEVQLAQLLVENTEAHPIVVQLQRHIDELQLKRNEEIRRVVTRALAKGQNPEIYQDLVGSLNMDVASLEPLSPQVQQAREVYQAWVSRMDTEVRLGSPQAAIQAQVEGTLTQPLEPAASPEEKPGEAASPPPPAVLGASAAISLTLGPRQEQELARLRRDYEVHRNSYQGMQRRLELAKVTQRLGKSDEGIKFKIIESARLPTRPVWPKLWVFFLASLAAGAAVGSAMAFAVEYFDESFHTSEDLQAAVALPILGTISRIVTEDDLADWRQRRQEWLSLVEPIRWVKTSVLQPLWARVDQALVRWGL